MATRPKTTGGASAPSNVVRLPTAAALKVDNLRWRKQRIAATDACKDNPWGAMWSDQVRVNRARERAREQFAQIERTPELALVLAILDGMSREARLKVLSFVVAAKIRNPDCMSMEQALTVARHVASCRAPEDE